MLMYNGRLRVFSGQERVGRKNSSQLWVSPSIYSSFASPFCYWCTIKLILFLYISHTLCET